MSLENETYNLTIEYDISGKENVSFLYVLPALIAILALVGNSFIVAVYFKYKSLRDSMTSFIINLGLTDLLTGVVVLVVLAFSMMDIQDKNYFACLSSFRITTYLTIVSQALILVTTFERYMGICQRDNYSKVMTSRLRIGLIVSAWLLPLPLSLAPFFNYNYWEEVGCHFPHILPKRLLLSRALLLFLLAAIAMAVYSKIRIKARQIHLQIRPAPLQGINAFTARSKSIKRSIRNGKIIGFVTMIFFASWLPYQIVLLCYFFGGIELHRGILYTTKHIGLSSSIVNPFLYAWQRKDIRNRLIQMLRFSCKTIRGHEGTISFQQEPKQENDAAKNIKILSERMEIQQPCVQETSRQRARMSKNMHTEEESHFVEVIELL